MDLSEQKPSGVRSLLLLPRNAINLKFGEQSFELSYRDNAVEVRRDDANFVTIRLSNHQVAYKARILGEFFQSEQLTGEVDFRRFFLIDWRDDVATPEVVLLQYPDAICREYRKGQKIELGIERVGSYRIVYRDEVTADITQVGEHEFEFHFSTGFNGNMWKDPDGSHSIKFKGIRLDADEDGYNSESKFIISRSKYTDNLIFILQDDATVYING